MAAASSISIWRNGEGPGDQEPEVVRDVRGVGQLQVVGGHQLTQHLGGHRVGWAASPRASGPWLWGGGGGGGAGPQKGLQGHMRSR